MKDTCARFIKKISVEDIIPRWKRFHAGKQKIPIIIAKNLSNGISPLTLRRLRSAHGVAKSKGDDIFDSNQMYQFLRT